MSDTIMYAGAFITCQNEVLEKEATMRRCSNEECYTYLGADPEHKFCPYCAAEVKDWTVSTVTGRKVDAEAFADAHRQSVLLFGKERSGLLDFYVPKATKHQRRFVGPDGLYFGPYGEFFPGEAWGSYTPITALTIKTSVEELAKRQEALIGILRQEYGGEHKVQIQWGILTDFTSIRK